MQENLFFFMKLKHDVRYFQDNLPLRQALEMMKKHGYSAVPVLDNNGVYTGSVSEGDFLWYLMDHQQPGILDQAVVGDLVRRHFMPAVSNSISIPDLLEASLHQNYVPVVDDRKIFIGIVTRQTLLRYLMKRKTGKVSLNFDTMEALEHLANTSSALKASL